jgi:hypothetical protein
LREEIEVFLGFFLCKGKEEEGVEDCITTQELVRLPTVAAS